MSLWTAWAIGAGMGGCAGLLLASLLCAMGQDREEERAREIARELARQKRRERRPRWTDEGEPSAYRDS